MTELFSDQTHFWQISAQNLAHAELCNALYERELMRLSQSAAGHPDYLARKLSSLPFHVRNAACNILHYPGILSLDSQNASWYHKQLARCPARRQQADPIIHFYQKMAKPGLIVPVYREQLTLEGIFLDSVDEVDEAEQRLHCNEHGWFSFSGTPLHADNCDKFLLKPNKAIMTAACCGHQWLNNEKKTPRLLTLRELLLSSRVNWQNFARPLPSLSL